MHDVFAEPARCAILYLLQESTAPTDVDELVGRVAARWPEFAPGDVDPSPGPSPARHIREQIRYLAEFGLLAHDTERGTVRFDDDVTITVTPPWQTA